MSDSEEDDTPVQHVNVVFVGEPNVGKTSLIRRFCFDDFLRQYSPTIGSDFYIKRLILPAENGHRQDVVLKMTDIAGTGRKDHMLDKYLFKADMIVLVYDITNRDSFDHLTSWIDAITALITSPPLTAIIGNKCDLEHQRCVRLDITKQLIKEHSFYSFLTSAKTGEATSSSFVELVAKYVGISMKQIQREKQNTVLKVELSADKLAQSVVRRRVHVHEINSSVCTMQ